MSLPKFRGWDKTNNEMISWHRLLNGYNLRNVFMRPEMCGLILMQSTGLTDKNGVEIYCDDVLTDGKSKRMVIWREDDSQIQLSVDDDTYESRIKLTQQLIDIFSLTVCGNIHESPELMGGE